MAVISKIMQHTGNHAAEITPNDVVDYHRAAWRLRGKPMAPGTPGTC